MEGVRGEDGVTKAMENDQPIISTVDSGEGYHQTRTLRFPRASSEEFLFSQVLLLLQKSGFWGCVTSESESLSWSHLMTFLPLTLTSSLSLSDPVGHLISHCHSGFNFLSPDKGFSITPLPQLHIIGGKCHWNCTIKHFWCGL